MAKVDRNIPAAPRSSWPIIRRLRRSSIRNSRRFFPSNAVEYFVSYYDLLPARSLHSRGRRFISKKEATINQELDKMRLAATRSLFERARLRDRPRA